MKYEIDKSKEWFSEIIDGAGIAIDIDAIFKEIDRNYIEQEI